MVDVAGALRVLVESLVALAASPSDQVADLDRHGFHNDELALDFDHPVGLLWVLSDAGVLDRGAVDRLRLINELLGEMSGPANAARWTDVALADDPGWAEVRRRAGVELASLAARDVVVPELPT